MTLTRLLDIKPELIRDEERLALLAAEEIWCLRQRPSQSQALAEFLDHMIDYCKENSLIYPPVFLKRKIQLERGTWKPRLELQNRDDIYKTTEVCANCKGLGYLPMAKAQGSLCPTCFGKKRT
jgi:hypothetical protein